MSRAATGQREIAEGRQRTVRGAPAGKVHAASAMGRSATTPQGPSGTFGRSPSDPIPAGGMSGALAHLARLRSGSNRPLLFHRLGSIRADKTGHAITCFEVVGTDGRHWDLLFFSDAPPRRLGRLPGGYRMSSQRRFGAEELLSLGSLNFCPRFPLELVSQSDLGLGALRHRDRSASDWTRDFARPSAHEQRIARLLMPQPPS